MVRRESRQAVLVVLLVLFVATPARAQQLASHVAPVQQQASKQFYLRHLNVSGNKRTRLQVVLRMIPLREGDLFDQSKWEQGIDALNRSGLFNPLTASDYVFILDHALSVVDIELRVTERDYQRVDLDGGGGTTGGFSIWARLLARESDWPRRQV